MTTRRRTDDPRWRRKNAGVMLLGALLITAGLSVILGLTPPPKDAGVEKLQHYIAAALVAAGIPFLIFGDGPEALGWIRGIIPIGKRGRSEEYRVPVLREPDVDEARGKPSEGGGPG